jgi:hypothetical protein
MPEDYQVITNSGERQRVQEPYVFRLRQLTQAVFGQLVQPYKVGQAEGPDLPAGYSDFPEQQAAAERPKSRLGTPIYEQIEIPAFSYEDRDGNVIEYPDFIFPPTTTIEIDRGDNIVMDPIAGGPGTFKQIVQRGDWQLSIKGSFFSPNPEEYPEEQVRQFLELTRVNKQIGIQSELLELFDIREVVFDSPSFAAPPGRWHVQPFEITAISDRDKELELKQGGEVPISDL